MFTDIHFLDKDRNNLNVAINAKDEAGWLEAAKDAPLDKKVETLCMGNVAYFSMPKAAFTTLKEIFNEEEISHWFKAIPYIAQHWSLAVAAEKIVELADDNQIYQFMKWLLGESKNHLLFVALYHQVDQNFDWSGFSSEDLEGIYKNSNRWGASATHCLERQGVRVSPDFQHLSWYSKVTLDHDFSNCQIADEVIAICLKENRCLYQAMPILNHRHHYHFVIARALVLGVLPYGQSLDKMKAIIPDEEIEDIVIEDSAISFPTKSHLASSFRTIVENELLLTIIDDDSNPNNSILSVVSDNQDTDDEFDFEIFDTISIDNVELRSNIQPMDAND
ncbi:TPA: hypothetical protein ACN98P_004565 [Vibrio parahaemolyticus]